MSVVMFPVVSTRSVLTMLELTQIMIYVRVFRNCIMLNNTDCYLSVKWLNQHIEIFIQVIVIQPTESRY